MSIVVAGATEAEGLELNKLFVAMQACLTEKTTKSFDAAVGLLKTYVDKTAEGQDTKLSDLEKKILEVEAGENPDLIEALDLLKVMKAALDGNDGADGLQKLEKLFSDAAAAKELSSSNATTLQSQQQVIDANKLLLNAETKLREALAERVKALEEAEAGHVDCAPCFSKLTVVMEAACAGSNTEINEHFASVSESILAKFNVSGSTTTTTTTETTTTAPVTGGESPAAPAADGDSDGMVL